ncbi:MAG: peptidase M3 [Candidatus Latescibacteria bacterium]|nr:peptidase M3 [Candidatus Latescibacterota bacterium]NIO27254.1 peptidase M3 [Candidatus Latescibacterota bacterium]NIO54778.1 peptidase M3 [Candidatus Latescibacterota bacterium]NIT00861.1 peptidase M3 [Candidatus Latescibacterota bacterium]NIT37784.1 peptidase M3 [Candidatus Latescibacterota bacterium]
MGDFSKFLRNYLLKAEPLSREVNIAYWNASISGKKEDFNRYADLQVKLQLLHSKKEAFEKLRQWKMDSSPADPLVKRQIELLYNDYLRNQIDPKLNKKITKLFSKIENQFNVYRAKLDGRTVTSNEIIQILKTSEDSDHRKKAWEAGKEAGALVRDDLITLVKLRNEAAHSLGYDNFYGMSLALGEQNEEEIVSLFDELETLTLEPYESMKDRVDEFLAARYRIAPEAIRPWHYEDPFFQEAPRIFDVNLDQYYESQDILDLIKTFYAGIDLDVEDILQRSDLFEKPGKVQHAFCTDIDRKGDIRILANVKNNENWAGTMLHELGHAVYIKYIDASLPFLLREEAHTFTTEAVAMLFGRLSKDAEWIQATMRISDAEKQKISEDLGEHQRLSQLIFTRWCQVMLHFERELYKDPDRNLNELWWDIVWKYQRLTPPENRNAPDWASKIHIVSAPVYYHNYMLGELLASQLDHYVRSNIAQGPGEGTLYRSQPELGRYLKEKVFQQGARYRWNRMVEHATNEKLTPRYFVDQFVR